MSFDIVQYQNLEMKSHWYQHDAIDLYYFEKGDGNIAKIHLCVMGQVLEWNPYDLVRTGLMIEEERAGGLFEIVQYDKRTNEKCLKQCLLIVQNAFLIPPAQRQKLMDCLMGLQKLTFWQKLKKFVS